MDTSIRELQNRAIAGDVRALAVLGRRLLCGEGVNPVPQDGILYLEEASRQGDGEAATVLAGLMAHGVLHPRDVGRALDMLLLGAERGWAPAQTQMRFLARAEGENWAALRRRADVRALTSPPIKRSLSENPRIRVLEGFATAAECDWLIDLTRGSLKPALVYRGANDQRREDMRTNFEADLSVNAFDLITATFIERAAVAAGVTRSFCEVAKVLHYERGQEFTLHSDFFDPAAHSEEIALRGQRIATLLVYLNDDYEGGETDFPKAGVRYKGRKGDALLFSNVDETGAPDPLTFHAGLPPASGEKWLFSQWVRGKAINAFMTPGAERETLDPAWLRKI